MSNDDSPGVVGRFDFQGNPLGTFNNGIGVEAMAVVGSEVWMGNLSGPVNRYDFQGSALASFNAGIGIGAIASFSSVPEPPTSLLLTSAAGLVLVSRRSRRRG